MENANITAKDWIILLLSISVMLIITIIGLRKGVQGCVNWNTEITETQNKNRKANKKRTLKKRRRVQMEEEVTEEEGQETSRFDDSNYSFSIQSMDSSPSTTNQNDQLTTVMVHGMVPPNTPLSSEEELY